MSDDYRKVLNKHIKTQSEYKAVVLVAHDRIKWKAVVEKVTKVYCEWKNEKEIKRREARKAKTEVVETA